MNDSIIKDSFFEDIKDIILQGKNKAKQSIDKVLILLWFKHIG